MSDENEIIEGEYTGQTALAVREQHANVALFGSDDPVEVVERAVKVANALKSVIASKGLVKNIGGREYVEIAGWQTLGAMLCITTVCEWTRPLSNNGFEARVLVQSRNGAVIGSAEAQCTRDERLWSKRDDYALRSMAQTRATSKALRSVLGFVVVLAGYKDTPADEMPDAEDSARSGTTNEPGRSETHQPDTKATKEPPKGSTASEPSPAQLRSAHASVNALLSDERLTPWEVAEAVASVLGPDADVSKCNDLPQLRELHKALNRKVKAATGEIPL